MTNKDLTWKLKAQPTAGELADLVKQGVLTAAEARAIIFNKGKKDNPSGKTTVVHLLLDRSGSMGSVQQATIDGYNEYINSLKDDGGKYKVSLTLFDSDHTGKLCLEKRHDAVNIDDVPELTTETYQPRGGTPLIDAFCTTLNDVTTRADEKNLFVVLTDGEENMSKEYKSSDMKRLKKKFENKGNWSFVYIGANQDAWAIAKDWGYSLNNVSNYNSTVKGTGAAFATMSVATRSFSVSPSSTTDAYFTDAQKAQNEQTK